MTHQDEIDAAHPVRSDDYSQHSLAMELVHERHAKVEFVDLVNWLLLRAMKAETKLSNLERLAKRWDADGLPHRLRQLRRVLSGETPPAPGEEWKLFTGRSLPTRPSPPCLRTGRRIKSFKMLMQKALI